MKPTILRRAAVTLVLLTVVVPFSALTLLGCRKSSSIERIPAGTKTCPMRDLPPGAVASIDLSNTHGRTFYEDGRVIDTQNGVALPASTPSTPERLSKLDEDLAVIGVFTQVPGCWVSEVPAPSETYSNLTIRHNGAIYTYTFLTSAFERITPAIRQAVQLVEQLDNERLGVKPYDEGSCVGGPPRPTTPEVDRHGKPVRRY